MFGQITRRLLLLQKQAMTSSWCLKGNAHPEMETYSRIKKKARGEERRDYIKKRLKIGSEVLIFPPREAEIADIEIAGEPSCFTHIQKKRKKKEVTL